MENVPGVSELFEENSVIRKPFLHLANESSQSSYYKDNFGLVVSIKEMMTKNRGI